MHDGIVGITLERIVGMDALHPLVERIVQEQIGQQRTYDALNAKGNFRFEREIRQWRSGNVLDLRRKE